MKVRVIAAHLPITSYRLATELENVFSVKFGAIVTENNNNITVSIPFSEYWIEISKLSDDSTDDDIPAIMAAVAVTKLPNGKPILKYKSKGWIRNAKDFEREVYSLLQLAGDKVASPELDKMLIKIKKTLSAVLAKFDSKSVRSETVRTSPQAVHDEEE